MKLLQRLIAEYNDGDVLQKVFWVAAPMALVLFVCFKWVTA